MRVSTCTSSCFSLSGALKSCSSCSFYMDERTALESSPRDSEAAMKRAARCLSCAGRTVEVCLRVLRKPSISLKRSTYPLCPARNSICSWDLMIVAKKAPIGGLCSLDWTDWRKALSLTLVVRDSSLAKFKAKLSPQAIALKKGKLEVLQGWCGSFSR